MLKFNETNDQLQGKCLKRYLCNFICSEWQISGIFATRNKSEKHKNCAIAMFAQFRHVSDHGQRNVRNFISSLYETVS